MRSATFCFAMKWLSNTWVSIRKYMSDFHFLIEIHWRGCIFYSKTHGVAQGQFTRCQRFGAILRALEPWRSVWKCASICCVSAINVFYEFYTNLHDRHQFRVRKPMPRRNVPYRKRSVHAGALLGGKLSDDCAAPKPLRIAMKSVATPWVSVKKCHATTHRQAFRYKNQRLVHARHAFLIEHHTSVNHFW